MSKLDLILESGSRKGIWPSSVTGWSSKPKMGRCKSLIVGTDDGNLLIKRLNLKPVEGRDGVWEAVSGSDTIMEVQQMDWLHHAEIRIFFGYLTVQGVTDLVDLIRTTIYGEKPPVMVMRQEESKVSDALKAKFPEWDISVIGFYTRRFPQSRLEAVVKDYGLVQNGSTDWYNSPNSNFVVRFGSRPFPTFAIAVKAPRLATEMAKFEQGYSIGRTVMVMRQEEGISNGPLSLFNDEKKELENKFKDWKFSLTMGSRVVTEKVFNNLKNPLFLKEEKGTDFWYSAKYKVGVEYDGAQHLAALSIQTNVFSDFHKYKAALEILDKAIASAGAAMVMRQEEAMKFNDWKDQPLDPSSSRYSCYVTDSDKRRIVREFGLVSEGPWVFSDVHDFTKQKIKMMCLDGTHSADSRWHVACDINYKMKIEKLLKEKPPVMVMRQEEAAAMVWPYGWAVSKGKVKAASKYLTQAEAKAIVKQLNMEPVVVFREETKVWTKYEGRVEVDMSWSKGPTDHLSTIYVKLRGLSPSDLNKLIADIEKAITIKPPVMVMRQEEAQESSWKLILKDNPKIFTRVSWAGMGGEFKFYLSYKDAMKLVGGLEMRQGRKTNNAFTSYLLDRPHSLPYLLVNVRNLDNLTAENVVTVRFADLLEKEIQGLLKNIVKAINLDKKPPVMVMRQEEARSPVAQLEAVMGLFPKWVQSRLSGAKHTYLRNIPENVEVSWVLQKLRMTASLTGGNEFTHHYHIPTTLLANCFLLAASSNTKMLQIEVGKFKGTPDQLKHFLGVIEREAFSKPPVMVMRQEEARALSTKSANTAVVQWIKSTQPNWSNVHGERLMRIFKGADVLGALMRKFDLKKTGRVSYSGNGLYTNFLIYPAGNDMYEITLMMDGTLGIKDIVTAIEYEIAHPPVMVMRQEEANYNTWLDSLKLEWRHDWPTNTIFTIISGSKIGDLIKKLKLKKDKTPWCDWSEEQEVIEVYWSGSINPAKVAVRTDVPAATEQVIKDTVEKIDRLASKQPVMVMRQEEASSRFDKILEINLEKVVQTWMKSPENVEWEGAPAYCRRKVSTGGQGLLIKHFDMLKVQGHGEFDTYFTTEDEPEAISMDRETIVVFYNKWKGSLKNFVDFIKTVNRLLSTKPPVMVMRQEEAKAASPILWSKFEQFYTGRLKPEFKGLWRAINRNWNLKLDPDSKKVPNYSNKGIDFLYTTDVCDLYSDYFINVTGQEARKKVEAFAKQFMEAGGKLPVMVMRQEEAVNTALTGATSDLAQLRKVFKKWPSWKPSEVRSAKNTFYMTLDPKADVYRIVNELGLSLESGSGTPSYFAATTGILDNCFNLVTGRRNGAPPRMEFYLSSFFGTPEQLKNILVAIDHSLVKPPVMVMRQEEELMDELYNKGRWFRDKDYWIRAITKAEADALIKKYNLSGRSAPFANAITGDLGSLAYKSNTCVMTSYVTDTGGILPWAALTDHQRVNKKKEAEGRALVDTVIGGEYAKPPVMVMRQEESRLNTVLNEVGWAKAKAFATANGWWIGGRTLGLRINAKQADDIIRQFKMQAVAGGPTWKFEGITVTKRETEGYDKLDVLIHDYSAGELYQVVTKIDQIVKSVKPPVMVMRQEEAKISSSDIAMLKDAYPDWTFSTTAPGRTINRAWIVVGKPAAEAVRRWVGPTYHQGDVVTVDDKQEPIIVSVHGKYASTVDLFRRFLFLTDSIIKKVKPVKPPVMVMRQEEASVNEMKLKWTKFELAGSTFYTCTLISEIAAQKMIADKKMKLEPAGVDRWWNTDYITTQLLLTKNKAGKNSFPSYEVTVNGMDWRNAVEKAAGPRQSSQEETIKIA